MTTATNSKQVDARDLVYVRVARTTKQQQPTIKRDVIAFLRAARDIDARNDKAQQALDDTGASDREWSRQYRRVQDEYRAAAKAAGFANVRRALDATQALVRAIDHSMP